MPWNTKVKLITIFCNLFELAGVIIVLSMAFAFQIILHELPCPLCLLQRVGFFLIAIGFLMNLHFGFRLHHYAMTILGALFTAFVALRQISLHVIPGTGFYGSPFLGYRLYTWSFIIATIIIFFTTILFCINQQYLVTNKDKKILKTYITPLTHTLFVAFVIILFLNIITVFLECGFGSCPSSPTHYLF